MQERMYSDVLEIGLTYGQASDACVHEGKKVTRAIWGGYWELRHIDGLTAPIIVAVLKSGLGVVPATPYMEDRLAMDWMIVR